ncbi:3-hydroxyacyl-CoA dehydrogenase [Terasakiella brassicae]|uniref:3-hydroxyacyl-CoA dehydrogenase n=1 Tax=Terasakiella brassicae TaxID=1634917 RepID=A0A917C2T2_9PROT|nr:SDR family NAD(P)-dependent oxidoreductase [Terasakiella brassicae]GGF69503.1 3-hydroxyacyl-CoA dehydrogenase [Terasakiella brassicae]
MNVQGLAAIVTGGASGLGEATARKLASEGAKVAIFDMNVDAAQKVADEIGGIAVECNVSDAASAEAAFASAREAHGPARVVVSCAGIAPASKIVGRNGAHDLDLFSKVINVNLVGTFNMTRLACADMLELDPVNGEERGVVVNTASIAFADGQIGQAAYAASKGGVVSLTLPVAREMAPKGIRVMTIAPGIMATPMLLGMPEEVQDALNKSVPCGRMGKPEEYADLVNHIVNNAYLSGEVIRMDGALRMAPK